jgi:hypothetical protein
MPINDPYADLQLAVDGPLVGGFAITPAAADLPTVTRAIMVAVSGDLAVTFRSGDSLTLPGLVPGAVYPLRLTRVNVAGTTATGIVGLY